MNGATMTMARHLATKAVKDQWARQRKHWVWVEHRELVQASMAYLAEHPELIEQAAETSSLTPKVI
jgi:hypothetical protein